jgi:hypothetical protein
LAKVAGEEGQLDAGGWRRELHARALATLDDAALSGDERLCSRTELIGVGSSASRRDKGGSNGKHREPRGAHSRA